jgi:protein-S-isoprenylcysteine O-methyltransferase Ste14
MASLAARSWRALGILAVVTGLLLFVPAGTLRYPEAWAYLAVFLGASAATTVYLFRTDRDLLERRLHGGPTAEKRPAQKAVMLFTSLGFIGLLVVPALDRRYAWSQTPLSVVVAGDVLVAVGFLLIVRVYRENSFAAATIGLAPDQTVVSTGPYALVRHPMYAGALLYLLGTPLALGSWWGLVPLAATLPFLAWRLFDEERFLAENLPGYKDYQRRVRYRLLPRVW